MMPLMIRLVPNVAMKGFTRSLVMINPLVSPIAIPIRKTPAMAPGTFSGITLHDVGGHHRRDADRIGNGKINRSADQHQGLSNCNDPQGNRPDDDIQHD